MYRFWNDIIAPCLEAAESKTIVEIGSNKGENTRNLLDFCQQHEGHLYAIDTAPQPEFYDLLKEDSEHTITFIQDLSLNVLDKLPDYDTLLLDGDHNWYTVYHELKMIASSTKPFPLVILHDVDWPYDRRDLFYDPTNIPTEYLPPIENKGIDPISNELCENGCNAIDGFWHSVAHHTPRTGVLTAIEDFLKENPDEYRFFKIPMNNGLGFILSEHDSHPQTLIDFLNTLMTSENIRNLIHHAGDCDSAHVEAAVVHEKEKFKIKYNNLHSEYSNLQSEYGNLQSKYGNLQSEYGNLQSEYGNLQSKYGNLQSEYGNLQSEYDNLQSKYKELPTIYENSASFLIGSKFVNFYWKIRTLFGYGKK